MAQKIIPSKDHTEVVDVAEEATCTTEGKTEGKHCSVCGTVIVAQKIIPSKGHSEVDDVAVGATCTTKGKTAGKHCDVCNEVLIAQEIIPATGHMEVVDMAVAATCTTPGLTEGKYCSMCNMIFYAQTVIPATGHAEEIDPAVEATCTASGWTEGKHCSVCNTIIVAQMVIPDKGGHKEVVTPAVEATCITEGKTESKHCSVCGLVIQVSESTGFLEHTIVVDARVEPTCTETGLTEGRHCSVCNTVISPQTAIPANGHYWVPSFSSSPSATSTGVSVDICILCNETRKEIIPHLGCSNLRGDADCNGVVDLYDALRVMQYDAGWDVTLCMLNADCNSDGSVNIDDVLQILLIGTNGDLVSASRTMQMIADYLTNYSLVILEQPMDQYVTDGQTATFSVKVSDPVAQYQWYVSYNNGVTWRSVNNATSDTYTVISAPLNSDGHLYRCQITGGDGTLLISDAATLYVYPAVELPVTGDRASLLLWSVLLIASLGCLAFLLTSNKRADRNTSLFR